MSVVHIVRAKLALYHPYGTGRTWESKKLYTKILHQSNLLQYLNKFQFGYSIIATE